LGFAAKAPARRPNRAAKTGLLRRLFLRLLRWTFLLAAVFYGLAAGSLAALRWIDPPSTAVQLERRVEAWLEKAPYRKRYVFQPLGRLGPHIQHAVLTSEDARFYQHHGFDWTEVRNAVEDQLDDGRSRGASTITQQLVKNLFLTTRRSVLRKGVEVTLVPLAELILSKRRILELYLNVVEWGPGVYGADAAARFHYGVPASALGRERAARLAAILPSPLHRKPARMNEISARILERMAQTGW
jgi:monofunctional biosynthetic peptidoglycan transglycosylase